MVYRLCFAAGARNALDLLQSDACAGITPEARHAAADAAAALAEAPAAGADTCGIETAPAGPPAADSAQAVAAAGTGPASVAELDISAVKVPTDPFESRLVVVYDHPGKGSWFADPVPAPRCRPD